GPGVARHPDCHGARDQLLLGGLQRVRARLGAREVAVTHRADRQSSQRWDTVLESRPRTSTLLFLHASVPSRVESVDATRRLTRFNASVSAGWRTPLASSTPTMPCA